MAKRGKRATRRALSDSSDESDSESEPQTKQPRVTAGDESSDVSDVEIDSDESGDEQEKGDDCDEQTSDEESDGEPVDGLIDDEKELAERKKWFLAHFEPLKEKKAKSKCTLFKFKLSHETSTISYTAIQTTSNNLSHNSPESLDQQGCSA